MVPRKGTEILLVQKTGPVYKVQGPQAEPPGLGSSWENLFFLAENGDTSLWELTGGRLRRPETSGAPVHGDVGSSCASHQEWKPALASPLYRWRDRKFMVWPRFHTDEWQNDIERLLVRSGLGFYEPQLWIWGLTWICQGGNPKPPRDL